jgi:hypothetical protein
MWNSFAADRCHQQPLGQIQYSGLCTFSIHSLPLVVMWSLRNQGYILVGAEASVVLDDKAMISRVKRLRSPVFCLNRNSRYVWDSTAKKDAGRIMTLVLQKRCSAGSTAYHCTIGEVLLSSCHDSAELLVASRKNWPNPSVAWIPIALWGKQNTTFRGTFSHLHPKLNVTKDPMSA